MDQKVGQRLSQSMTGHTNSNEVRLNIIYLRLNNDFAAVFLFVFFLFVLFFIFFKPLLLLQNTILTMQDSLHYSTYRTILSILTMKVTHASNTVG